MTHEQQQEVNRQSLDLFKTILEKDKAQLVFATYRKPDGKIGCLMGFGVNYVDMVEAFKLLGESLVEMPGLIKKHEDGN